MIELEFVSHVSTPRDLVWSGITTFHGVNKEFFPLLRMSCPFPDLRLNSAMATGQPLFRSWLLLFGIMPIEFDLLGLSSVIENVSFEEKSTMALISEWNHHRFLCDENAEEEQDEEKEEEGSERHYEDGKERKIARGGTIIRDRLLFTPRIPGTGFILRLIVRALFSYRHMRLRMIY
jgi:hypothetical protein